MTTTTNQQNQAQTKSNYQEKRGPRINLQKCTKLDCLLNRSMLYRIQTQKVKTQRDAYFSLRFQHGNVTLELMLKLGYTTNYVAYVKSLESNSMLHDLNPLLHPLYTKPPISIVYGMFGVRVRYSSSRAPSELPFDPRLSSVEFSSGHESIARQQELEQWCRLEILAVTDFPIPYPCPSSSSQADDMLPVAQSTTEGMVSQILGVSGIFSVYCPRIMIIA